MPYNTIPTSKFGDCSSCGDKDVACRKVGKSLMCVHKCYKNIKAHEAIEKAKQRDQLRSLTTKVRELGRTPENKAMQRENQPLEQWFTVVKSIIKANPHCENCGGYVSEKYYRAACAHILQKAIFPSVATHPLNYVIAPAGCCHELTHRLDKFSQQKFFGLAVRRFRKFEQLITEKHKLLDEFKRLADEHEEKEFMSKEQKQ